MCFGGCLNDVLVREYREDDIDLRDFPYFVFKEVNNQERLVLSNYTHSFMCVCALVYSLQCICGDEDSLWGPGD